MGPLNWLRPVEFVVDGKTLTGRVVWDDGETVTVQTEEIVDWDDDGLDEEGAPIMRPLYRRYYIPITNIEQKEEG